MRRVPVWLSLWFLLFLPVSFLVPTLAEARMARLLGLMLRRTTILLARRLIDLPSVRLRGDAGGICNRLLIFGFGELSLKDLTQRRWQILRRKLLLPPDAPFFKRLSQLLLE